MTAHLNEHKFVDLFSVAVVVAFFICWAPHHAQRLFAIYGNAQDTDDDIDVIYYYLTYVSGILYFVSTCINPFLYNIMSHKFREAFKVIVIAIIN